jgi:predicted glycosyltransferase
MRILFSMRHAGALRNFASTLEELARRGHRVHLTFLTRDKLDDQRILNDLTSRYPGITNGGINAVAPSRWLGLATPARAVADYARFAR